MNRDREKDRLRMASALARAAQRKADDMAEKGYFASTSPVGRAAWDFKAAENYMYADAGGESRDGTPDGGRGAARVDE